MELLKFGESVPDFLGHAWTFLLLLVRFAAMMSLVPGIGMGSRGLQLRKTGIFAFALAATVGTPIVDPPQHWVGIIGPLSSEFLLGMVLGLIPTMIVAGVQLGAQLSSTTMGLGAGQLVDPTLGISVTSLARVFGDLVIIFFLMIGGHHVIVYAVSGLGGAIQPGTFLITEDSLSLLVDRSADIFRVGVMISAPVIVALLLTQFVMGLITKAVPTVNIFIVSFPLTIGIGLILSALSLPDIMVFVEREFIGIENAVLVLSDSIPKTQ